MILGLSLAGALAFLSGFAKAAVEILTPVLKFVVEGVLWFVRTFFHGLKAVFDNLSVLAVILVVAVGSAWYFKTWDNDRVLQKCERTCPNPINKAKYKHPLKKKLEEKRILRAPVAPQRRQEWRHDFNGN